jgi:hypothetical protein
MRLYKAFLDDKYRVISYVSPSDSELVYSESEDKTYEIFSEDISDYIELNGYITVPIKERNNDISYCMFLDIDYTFSNVWDTETSIYVQDQILTDIRVKLIDAYFKDDYSEVIDPEVKSELLGIIGLSKMYVGDESYMYHQYTGGVWESSSPYIASIDRQTGVIEANFAGKTTITYIVDSGAGILTCFKTIEILREI